MKRLFVVLLISLALLAFCSCSGQNTARGLSYSSDDSQNLNPETTNSDLTESVSSNSETGDENNGQSFTKDFDGVILTIITDKSTYVAGEPITMTATLENKSGKDINLFYGAATTGDSAELMPRFEDLIEYPIRGDLGREDVITTIPFMQGEKCVQEFTFQTYTDYFQGTSENGYITIPAEVLPDYNKLAEPGVHSGKLCVQTCSDVNYPYGVITDYSLDFSITLI